MFPYIEVRQCPNLHILDWTAIKNALAYSDVKSVTKKKVPIVNVIKYFYLSRLKIPNTLECLFQANFSNLV